MICPGKLEWAQAPEKVQRGPGILLLGLKLDCAWPLALVEPSVLVCSRHADIS